MTTMKEQSRSIIKRFAPLKEKALRYRVVLFVFLVGLIYGFILYRINVYANVEPAKSTLDERLLEVKRVKIDEEAINKIEDLQDRNVNIESLFDNGRANPFQE